MDSFVYRWRNSRTRQWYIGYHKGSDQDGYICSSETARPEITKNQHEWSRKILRRGTKEQMVELERRLLKKLQARTNPQSLNLHNGNGQVAGGRKKGSRAPNWDLNHRELKKQDLNQVVDLLLTETDPERRLKIHQYLFRIVVA